MKNDDQKKDLHDKITTKQRWLVIMHIIRTYISSLWQAHKRLGALRIISSYIFFIFAMIAIMFTISVPVTSDFLGLDSWKKLQSRLITGGIAIANMIIYTIVLNWRKDQTVSMIIRSVFIFFVLYIDISIIARTVYELIMDMASTG